jgi:hypothetical protein
MDLTSFTIVAVAVLAFANGANDVSKGIATLAGSRRASYRQAIAWGTLWTACGAAAALLLGEFAVTALAMTLGGLVAGLRVAEHSATASCRCTATPALPVAW